MTENAIWFTVTVSIPFVMLGILAYIEKPK